MRDLFENEYQHVSGAGCSPQPPSGCGCSPTPPSKQKNNNGYGNGPESGPPPGHSGEHNPQLLDWNTGPKGPR